MNPHDAGSNPHAAAVPADPLYAVIPAGGSGTRLWPLSRARAPKFLHAFTGDGRSLIRATVDRLTPLAPVERIRVVTGGAHAAAVARELPELPTANVLVEPAPRDSAPAIGLAAAVIHQRDPTAVMGSFAADHLVRDEPAFQAAVTAAARAARAGNLVTVGIAPTAPETGFGYIRRGEPLDAAAYRVERFVEKPPREVAEEYLASGRYLWNASMFLWRTEVFLAELERQQPLLHDGLRRIAADWDTASREETLGAIWPTLPTVSVDHGVMQGAADRGLVATVPGSFGWTDVGDWDTLGSVLLAGPDGTAVLGEPADHLGIDARDCVVVPGAGRLVATLGVCDLVVVDTADVLLVCARERAQEVRRLVEELTVSGRTALV